MKYKFPKGFLWGASTSAHQVEGGNHNDWSEWEKTNAEHLANQAKTYWQQWQQEKFPEMLTPENYISGHATDHYHRYGEDFKLAKEFGHNATRFSIEWSRVEPEEGRFDENEIEHYRNVVRACLENGLEPFVTLWHWPVPLWLRDKKGVESDEFPKLFALYAERMVLELKEVKFWLTLNEPEIYASQSYLKGARPPQKKSIFALFKVMDRLTKTHILAYKAMKAVNPTIEIGIAKNNIWFEASDFLSVLPAKVANWFWNHLFLIHIRKHQDFIGLNHYFNNRIRFGMFGRNKNEKISDMGWELYPEALYRVIMDLRRYNKPIYITENGVADKGDKFRSWFIEESLRNAERAIAEGADVRGYLYWSLLDNFEWDKGFWPRFGLIEVNHKTLERKPRPSAYAYKKIIEANGLE